MMPMTTLCLLALATFAAPIESIAVDVDASSIKPEGPGIARQLGGKVTKALTDKGISVDDASTRHLRIEVRQTSFISYDVTFVIEVDGAVVEPGIENVQCERCPLAKMDEAVLAKLPEAVALMERAAEPAPAAVEEPEASESEPSSEGQEDEAEPSAEPSADKAKRKRGRPTGPVGYTGIGLGAGGLVMAVVGGVRMAAEPTIEKDTNAPEFELTRDPRPLGRALLGAGVATAVVGGVLVALDLTVLRRKRNEHARMPVVAPGLGSFVIQGRF